MLSRTQAYLPPTTRARSIAMIASGLLIAALPDPAVAAAPRLNAHTSIVGGHVTAIEDIPFQVTLYDPEITPGPGEVANPVQSQYCAGVILDATHVITAGHCVMNQQPRGVASPAQVEILAGTNDINTDDGQPPSYTEDPVSRTSFDPLWEPVSYEHDIGLLTLRNPLWVGPTPAINGVNKIAPIPLAGSMPSPGSILNVSGWGYDKELVGEARPSEEAGFQRYLQSTQVPLVPQSECAQAYTAAGQSAPTSAVCAGSAGHGPCYSDSGGPLFEGPQTPPGTYALLGIIDNSYGCAQAGFPAIYQSIVNSNNAQFVLSEPPQAPLELAPPTIRGTPTPEQALTCNPGSWSGEPTYDYRFYVDRSTPSSPQNYTALGPLSPQPTYAVGAEEAGERIACLTRATNAGGYDFDISPDLTVSGAISKAHTISAGPVPPSLTVVSKSCFHRRCAVNVRVSQGAGPAAVATVRATLSFKRWVPCRRPHKRMKCLHTLSTRPRVHAIPDEHYVVQTGRLQPDDYRLTLTAIDEAGVRQIHPTQVRLTVKPGRQGH